MRSSHTYTTLDCTHPSPFLHCLLLSLGSSGSLVKVCCSSCCWQHLSRLCMLISMGLGQPAEGRNLSPGLYTTYFNVRAPMPHAFSILRRGCRQTAFSALSFSHWGLPLTELKARISLGWGRKEGNEESKQSHLSKRQLRAHKIIHPHQLPLPYWTKMRLLSLLLYLRGFP